MFGLKKEKSSLFYKYLLSYLLIFMIPFATISIVFYQMSVKDLREEIIQSNIGNLEQVRDFSDSRMRELENIAMRISFDNRLTPYMLKQPFNAKEAIKELVTYQVNSSIIDGLFLKYYNDENVYSPKGSGTIENFMNNIYRFKDSGKDNFKDILESTSKPIVQPIELENEDQERIISYIYPIPPKSSTIYGTVVFFVNELTLKKFTQNILKDFAGNTYIFNDENEMLVANNVGKPLSIENVQGLLLEETRVVNKRINNENYSFVTVYSEESNWTFVAAMPTAQFYSKMSSLKTTIFITLLIVALLGIAISIYLSFKQYKPIRMLSQFISTNQDVIATTGDKGSELENIRETIEFIFEDSEKLRKKMHLQQPVVRDHFLLKLLKSNAKIQPDMDSLLKDLNISFTGDHFFVIMISFNEKISGEESLQNRERILMMLAEVSYRDCIGYGVELIHDNAVVLIVNTKDDAEDSRENFAKELTHQLSGLFQVMPTIGVGKTYIGIDLINRSFIEAAASIEHNLLHAKNDLVFFQDITVHKGNNLWYPIENQVQFIQSLKQGDQVVAKEALSNIIQNLKEKDISFHMLRSMCFDIINTVLKFISEFELPVNTEAMHKLVEFNSVNDLEDKVHVIIVDICHNIGKRKESHNNYLRNEILDYIHDQFKSHDLSLGSTAAEFQLSVSYLSRFIKDQTGSTFTQFVWKLRNEEFKQQLKETNVSIKDIVSDIGYVDVANFTRKFKQEEGLTPGQYRKRYKREDIKENAL